MIFGSNYIVNKMNEKLPYEATARMTSEKTLEISGKYATSGDWDRTLNPFKQEDKLLDAIKTFKKENPDISIKIVPTYGAEKGHDGQIHIFYKEDDGWDAKTSLSKMSISPEFEKYATIQNMKVLERAQRMDVPELKQSTPKKPMARYEDTLLNQIEQLNAQTNSIFSFSSRKRNMEKEGTPLLDKNDSKTNPMFPWDRDR